MVGLPLACLRRSSLASLACFRHVYRGRLPRGQWQPPVQRAAQYGRLFSDIKNGTKPNGGKENGVGNGPASALPPDPAWDAMTRCYDVAQPTPESAWADSRQVTIMGFLGKRNDKRSNMASCDLETPTTVVRIVSQYQEASGDQYKAHMDLRAIPSHSPVIVEGLLVATGRPPPIADHPHATVPLQVNKTSWDLQLTSIRCLNPFDRSIIVSKDAVWPPHQRHLQMRFDPKLFQRLHVRSFLMDRARNYLRTVKFEEVETPLLFKSTPEGAREFLVPTKRRGYAYALPQSPQQYKQLLMAGGLRQYFQFAKCFRDEDHRADRQPEFTQLDIEASFASGKTIMAHVEALVKNIYREFDQHFRIDWENRVCRHPTYDDSHLQAKERRPDSSYGPHPNPGHEIISDKDFRKMQFSRAMKIYGTDKPDLRIKLPYTSIIHDVTDIVPEEFVNMITSIEGPRCVDAVRFRFEDPESKTMLSPRASGDFIRAFMDGLPKTPLKLSPGSSPGVLVYDRAKPLNGLAPLGHEAAEAYNQLGTNPFPLDMENNTTWGPLEDGDVIILFARKPEPWNRTCSDIGRLRTAIHEAAVAQSLIPRTHEFKPIWIHRFPMFTPEESESGPGTGQGGSTGLSATHHPFTAPRAREDLELLRTDPLAATADHYDLVINGIEVGGGSRRIHVAKVQEYVFREVLGMDPQGVARFSHLLDALRAGCPPHAGFALGFDRFVSILCDVPSVRDVIAFPKNNKGQDLLVGSPSKYTIEQAKNYHLLV